MMFGEVLVWLTGIVRLVVILGVLVILWKAITAYRQHDSRPMLYLAIGMAFLLVLAPSIGLVHEFALDRRFVVGFLPGEPSVITTVGVFFLVEELFRLVGMIALLASLYVGERPTTQ